MLRIRMPTDLVLLDPDQCDLDSDPYYISIKFSLWFLIQADNDKVTHKKRELDSVADPGSGAFLTPGSGIRDG